jgi:3-oxoacyl-[acyl-carrier-protein] synthase III
MSIALSRVSVALPGRMEAVDEILGRNGWSATEQRLFTKVYKLLRSPTLAAGEWLEDLLLDAGRRALGDDSATLVLYGHTLLVQEFNFRPGFPDRFRAALGLAGVPFFGLSHIACTSVLRSVELARRYLYRPGADPADRVLVLGGDQGSIDDCARIVPRMTVGGDAAVAFTVRRGPGRYRYLGGAAQRDTRFHRSLRMAPDELRLFGSVCADLVLDTLTNAVKSAGLTLDDVDWFMPHLSNAMFWRGFCGQAELPLDRFCLDLLPEQGHTFGADALMALDRADRTGRLAAGQRCALISLGQGAYFQVVVVEVEES